MNKNKLSCEVIDDAYSKLKGFVRRSPLERNHRLSKLYRADVYLKREDLQVVRSYKLRGAYNLISSLSKTERNKGIVCASAGNHAQGVAYSCSKLKIKGRIYMPQNTPKQKVERVGQFGGKWIDIVLFGDSFDEAKEEALKYSRKTGKTFVHPFDDFRVIAGQATIAKEIFEDIDNVDYLVGPIGGGGLMSGMSFYSRCVSPKTKVIGIEPEGAPCMKKAIEKGCPVDLGEVDHFIDGASVQIAGNLTYKICAKNLDSIILVDEGRVCVEMIEMYQNDGIIAEPAGALAVSALEKIKHKIKGKKVVVIVSGGNNDITRYAEIMERSLLYQGLKHYFIIEFSQRPGSLRQYLDEVLGEGDDITLFEYIKKNNKEFGPALVGVELSRKEDYRGLLKRMDRLGIKYSPVNGNETLFNLLV